MKNCGKALLIPVLVLPMLFSLSSCNKDDKLSATRIAVFADNQLFVGGGGGTAYSDAFLKYHLQLCKEQNVDVIMISGDLANNALSSCYNLFEASLKTVYGTDESQYPEFVYTMGNHEWYDANEETAANAISLFKKHARIDTSALRKKSETEIFSQNNNTCADYYKVINGIPFLSISSSNESGLINSFEKEEIENWLNDISKMKTVKNGCPIFVSYHYAIKDVTYSFGQGANAPSTTLDNLLKDYPQVILFSGDTHFVGGNERTINQVDYTTINLGSSSYSRHVSTSCSMNQRTESFYNVGSGHAGKDTLTGDVAINYNRTPHIHIVDVDNEGNTTINRYFSTSDPKSPKHIGLEWFIPKGSNKLNFTYTSARYQNKDWAQIMYGKDGLDFAEGSTLTATKNNTNLVVNFPDCNDYNYCEHYRISVTADTTKYFDFVSHYYKWEDTAHNYSFAISNVDLPTGDVTKVKVEAFDFFDNPSTNFLELSF